MNQRATRLQECLDRLAAGEPWEDVLASCGEDRHVMAPLLRVALGMQAGRKPAAPRSVGQRLFAELASLPPDTVGRRADQRRHGAAMLWPFPVPAWFPGRPVLASALVLLLLACGVAATAAAAAARPGDLFYPVRRAVETVWRSTIGGPAPMPASHEVPSATSALAAVPSAGAGATVVARAATKPAGIAVAPSAAPATQQAAAPSATPTSPATLALQPTASMAATQAPSPTPGVPATRPPRAAPSKAPSGVPGGATAPAPAPSATMSAVPSAWPTPTAWPTLATSPTPSATSACPGISGTVSLDDGSPADGADVVVFDVAKPHPVAEVTTAADGSYSACGLGPGAYYLFAVRFTTQPFYMGTYDPNGDDQPDTVPLSAAVPSAAGIDVRMEKVGYGPPDCAPGVVAGTVTTQMGAAASGAVVALVGQGSGFLWEVTTDSAGSYQATGLCADAYWVHAFWHDGPDTYEGDYDPDGNGQPDVLQVDEGQWNQSGIDITVR